MTRTNPAKLPSSGDILAIDWGERRLGLAKADSSVRLPQPLKTISNRDSFKQLQEIIGEYQIRLIVVGLPRSLEGSYTKQSESIRDFAKKLRAYTGMPVVFTDETLSSVRARQLQKETKHKADLDSLAACYILEEFLRENKNNYEQ